MVFKNGVCKSVLLIRVMELYFLARSKKGLGSTPFTKDLIDNKVLTMFVTNHTEFVKSLFIKKELNCFFLDPKGLKNRIRTLLFERSGSSKLAHF